MTKVYYTGTAAALPPDAGKPQTSLVQARDLKGAHPEPARNSMPSLTGLRFVAAALVVLYHAVPALFDSPIAPVPVRNLIGMGYMGVSLFFVLSGFILTYTYLELGGGLRGSVREFYVARIARVYPVYVLALAVSIPFLARITVMPALEAGAWSTAMTPVISAPVLLQAWAPATACAWNCPGWTLSVEAFFYLLFPVLIHWSAKTRPHVFLGAATVCWLITIGTASIVGTVLDPIHSHGNAHAEFLLDAVRYNPIGHLPEFLIGIASARYFVDPSPRERLGKHLWLLRGVWGVGLSALAICVLAGGGLPYLVIHTGGFAPLWAVIILALALDQGPAGKVLAYPVSVRLGEASYALYLLHVPILSYVIAGHKWATQRWGFDVPRVAVLIAYLLLSTGLSLLVFRYWEQPARALVRRKL